MALWSFGTWIVMCSCLDHVGLCVEDRLYTIVDTQ